MASRQEATHPQAYIDRAWRADTAEGKLAERLNARADTGGHRHTRIEAGRRMCLLTMVRHVGRCSVVIRSWIIGTDCHGQMHAEIGRYRQAFVLRHGRAAPPGRTQAITDWRAQTHADAGSH